MRSPTRRLEAFDKARMCHEAFDRLAETKPDDRHREDTIQDSIFHRLEHRLTGSGACDVIQYGHKFVAHAADAGSRQTLTNDQQGITLDKLSACQRAICEVAQTVSSYLLWDTNHGLMPVPHDPFEHLNQPWLRDADLAELQDAWERHETEVEHWTDNPRDDLLSQSGD